MLPFLNPLQAGDLVQLLSGGPCMTLASIEGVEALCFWNERGSAQRESFPLVTLRRCELPASAGPQVVTGLAT